MEILDARGLECPLPVVKTKELLKDIDKVKVLVDNEIAIENLTKFAGVRHYQIVTGDDGDDFYAIIAKEGIDDDLKYLESQGVDIVSCGTCLDFFNRKELLQVGAVTNMYDIVERMEKAEKVIKP